MVHIYLAPVSHLTMPASSSYSTHTHKALLPLRRTYTPMMSPSPELHVKILMIGNSSVGKSSLLMRWSENQWLPEDEASATIGVEVKVCALLALVETSRYLIELLETKTRRERRKREFGCMGKFHRPRIMET